MPKTRRRSKAMPHMNGKTVSPKDPAALSIAMANGVIGTPTSAGKAITQGRPEEAPRPVMRALAHKAPPDDGARAKASSMSEPTDMSETSTRSVGQEEVTHALAAHQTRRQMQIVLQNKLVIIAAEPMPKPPNSIPSGASHVAAACSPPVMKQRTRHSSPKHTC